MGKLADTLSETFLDLFLLHTCITMFCLAFTIIYSFLKQGHPIIQGSFSVYLFYAQGHKFFQHVQYLKY
jgi:hypothetical protein